MKKIMKKYKRDIFIQAINTTCIKKSIKNFSI